MVTHKQARVWLLSTALLSSCRAYLQLWYDNQAVMYHASFVGNCVKYDNWRLSVKLSLRLTAEAVPAVVHSTSGEVCQQQAHVPHVSSQKHLYHEWLQQSQGL